MRACRSLLCMHAIFSWFPAQPGHRGPPRGVGAVTQYYHKGMDALCQFKATSLGLFQFKSCFSMRIPFPFAARSAKGPYLPSPHRWSIKRFPAAHTSPGFSSPLLQRLPNAAIVCLGAGMMPPPCAGHDLLQAQL